MGDFSRNKNPASSRTNATNGYYRNRPYNLLQGGYGNLPRDITINGTTVSPSLRLDGSSGASTWIPTVGASNFAETGTGTSSPDYGVAGTYGTGVDYKGANNKGHLCASTSAYAVTTNDFLIEVLVLDAQVAHYEYIMNKAGTVPATGAAYDLGKKATSGGDARKLGFTMSSGATVVSVTSSSAMNSGSYYYIGILVNRDENSTNGMLMYFNGANVGTANPSTLSGVTMPGNQALKLCHNPVLYTWNGNLYYVALYQGADWFASGAQCRTDADAFFAARYATITA